MGGRTLANSFIILEEAQNTSTAQMKMFLTRFGENSRMVICGDPRQVDLPVPGASGLADAVSKLEGVDGIATIRFGASDVVRHPIRSEEHTSELQSLMRNSYAVFCLKTTRNTNSTRTA